MLSYCTVEPNTLELLKALMQEPAFSKMDAEMQPMPKMLCNESWEDMKKTIIEEVRKI